MNEKKKNEKSVKDSKKSKKNKKKTDPNLFLFSEATSETAGDVSSLDSTDIVEISQSFEKHDNEDLEVPSYLRKGNL